MSTDPTIKPLRTKRWNDPRETGDGHRLLITRYRPRGVTKADATWDDWQPALGPSVELHAAAYGKGVLAIPWNTYQTCYLLEMRRQKPLISAIAQITLLCSSACEREARCHRSLLKELIEAELIRDG